MSDTEEDEDKCVMRCCSQKEKHVPSSQSYITETTDSAGSSYDYDDDICFYVLCSQISSFVVVVHQNYGKQISHITRFWSTNSEVMRQQFL